MPIQFACTQCGHPISVDVEACGEAMGCPECQEPLKVPDVRERKQAGFDGTNALARYEVRRSGGDELAEAERKIARSIRALTLVSWGWACVLSPVLLCLGLYAIVGSVWMAIGRGFVPILLLGGADSFASDWRSFR